LLVHIGDHSSNQATTLESQMIHMIQELFGRTLRSDHRGWAGFHSYKFSNPASRSARMPAAFHLVHFSRAINFECRRDGRSS
jgi:hypothetical protein